jgi:hypothetical protein
MGNADLYGLGIRAGIYLQWIGSLLANNLLQKSGKELQKVYLIFSFSLCVATYAMSFAGSCVFETEIELLYWLFWGGFMVVFAFCPSQTRLGAKPKWVGLDWSTALHYITTALMAYHMTWFIWYGYDRALTRLPCGTYHFFFAPLVDPSETFCFVRDYLTQLVLPVALPLVLIIPLVSFAMASEIKKSVEDSPSFRLLFPKSNNSITPQANTGPLAMTLPQLPLGSRLSLRFRRVYSWIKKPYRLLRGALNLPMHARSGIRLITPLDVKDRRYPHLYHTITCTQKKNEANDLQDTTASAAPYWEPFRVSHLSWPLS